MNCIERNNMEVLAEKGSENVNAEIIMLKDNIFLILDENANYIVSVNEIDGYAVIVSDANDHAVLFCEDAVLDNGLYMYKQKVDMGTLDRETLSCVVLNPAKDTTAWLSGYYEADGWVQKKAEMLVNTKEYNKLEITTYALTEQNVKVIVDNNLIEEVHISEGISKIVIPFSESFSEWEVISFLSDYSTIANPNIDNRVISYIVDHIEPIK